MRPRVLIVHPPVSLARDFIDYPYFSDLGAVQLAAVLRGRGHAVDLIDAYALPGSSLVFRPDGRAHMGAPVEEVLERARRLAPPDRIVVCTTPFHRPPARDDVMAALLTGLRQSWPRTPIVLADAYQSGQHYVEAEGDVMRAAYPEIDAWLKYEAEESIGALLDADEIPKGTHAGLEAPALDALPLPAWDLVDLGAHDLFMARIIANLGRGGWEFPIDGRTLPLITSRGCPFHCRHCSSNPGLLEGAPKTQRRYSVERLREIVTVLVKTHGATRLEVLDELVNVSERHFDAFLEIVGEAGVSFDIPNGMRADYLERRHFEKMRGKVRTVSVSAESGVQRVVDQEVGKQLDLSTIVRAAENAHDAGVRLMIHYIIGLPGETEHEVEQTLVFALDLYRRFRAWPAVQFATPLPGTALARGRSLPVVSDWGPLFQTRPSQPGARVSPDALLNRKRAFDHELRRLERR